MLDITGSSANQKTPSNQEFGVTAPQIALPKGGGALHGIGEKFAANPVTGTGNLSVPIAVSPGRAGFSPQLALNYDPGAGNGPFGLGWSLSLPAITRRTDRGLPKYQDSDEGDVFILSGAEDLVPVLVQDASGNWQRERLPDRNGCAVTRYRPRVEGLFSVIDPAERERIEENKIAKAKLRADYEASRAAIDKRVAQICDNAKKNRNGAEPDLPGLLARLDRAFDMAMATRQPGHAVSAIMASAKLLGLVVEKSVTAVGSTREFADLHGNTIEQQRQVIERLRQRVGSQATEPSLNAIVLELAACFGLSPKIAIERCQDDKNIVISWLGG
jgi:hypothetical protein